MAFQEDILQKLNPEQKQAVTHPEGPLLIVAGAGTGKTTVITRGIAYLIATKKVKPEEILALTFTDKAAGEMEERVDVLVPYGYTETWISTFHAFGNRVLEDNALEMGLVTNFRVLTRPEQIVFFNDHLFEFPLKHFRPLGDPTKYIESILALISRAKDEDVTPEDYIKYVQKLKKKLKNNPQNKELKAEITRQEEIALTYKKYEELMAKNGFIDFGDQVILTLKLFREHPAILKRYKEQFRYILVDEFQDTNYAQFELVKLLGEDHRNITVVGDDDQSIYKFRGAAISNILNFKKYYPDAKQIVLIRNYRSPQILLDSAYKLILNNNPDRLEVKTDTDKRLVSQVAQGKPIYNLHYDTVSTEADKVAQLIREKTEKGDWKYKDVAILVRSNDEADPFLRALNMENIPWQFSGAQGLYAREEIKLLLSFLRAVSNLEDSVSLFYLATSEIYQMPSCDINLITNYANRNNRSVYWAFKNLSGLTDIKERLTSEAIATVDKIISDLEKYSKLGLNIPTGELLYSFIHNSGYLARLTKQESIINEEKIKNIAKFFNIIKNTSTLLKYDRVNQFIKYLDMLISAGDDPTTAEIEIENRCVNVLTVHKAKGLEFPVVIMVGLVSDRFPTRFRSENIPLPDELIKDILPSGNFHLQEERRLFYVGMTRAKNELYFTSAKDYGGKRPKKVSIFVCETLGLTKDEITPYKRDSLETISAHAPKPEQEVLPLAPIPDDEQLNIGPYHVDDYLTCPLKYKYVHILRVPILQVHTVVYGNILHKVVEEYYKRKVNKVKVSREDMKQIFTDNWTSEGFLSRAHEEKRFEEGLKVIKKFYQRQEKEKTIPTYVEKEFNFIIGNNKISGRWDRIDVIDKDNIVIIDFKSSDVRDQDKADKRADDNLQLCIYALASKNVLGKLPEWVGLYFLESGLIGKCKKTEEDLDDTIDKINQAAKGIRQRDYHPTPGEFACFWCAYNRICPAAVTKPKY